MTRHVRVYWLPVAVWAVLIFTLSSISQFPETVQPIFSFDKIAHTIEYAIFAFLLARAFGHSKKQTLADNFRFFAIIVSVLYGVSDELHQIFVPLRTPSVLDFCYDSIGALIGQMIFRKK